MKGDCVDGGSEKPIIVYSLDPNVAERHVEKGAGIKMRQGRGCLVPSYSERDSKGGYVAGGAVGS